MISRLTIHAQSKKGSWTGILIKQVIPMLKRTGDGAIPGLIKDLLPYFENIRHRPPLTFKEYVKMKGLVMPDGVDESNPVPLIVANDDAQVPMIQNDVQEWTSTTTTLNLKPPSNTEIDPKDETVAANMLLAFAGASKSVEI